MTADSWLRRAAAGEPVAQQHLYEAHGGRLRHYLRRRMGTQLARSVSVSDLAQDVFFRVFQALSAMPADAGPRLFRAWLYRHADWVLANHGVVARRRFGESAAATQPTDLPNHGRDTSTGAVTRADQIEWLRALLARLEPRYRDVVQLRLQGLEFAAIATRLGIDEAAARQRYARVVRGLREAGPNDGAAE
jgi:RNA polymerase sigma factor (sigma-70 family)